MNVKRIAYYLGQYSPLPENDKFWGKGFTEWHNVAQARPLYPGHIQPKLPGAFGFYDLRCDETIEEQLIYANYVGIDAMCYWHYWFSGKRLLHDVLDRMLKLPNYGVGFMLGWANESWSGVWHGAPNRVLIEQKYDDRELIAHAELLCSYFMHDRYVRMDDGRTPFLIYKPRKIPNAKRYLAALRQAIQACGGGDLYLIGNWSPGMNDAFSRPEEYGLDAAVITPVGVPLSLRLTKALYTGFWKFTRELGFGPQLISYKSTKKVLEYGFSQIQGVAHATIVTGWDNTPRSGRRGLVLYGYNQNSLYDVAKHACEWERANANKLLFIKSWNEWAEGNVVEPCFKETWSAGNVLRSIFIQE